MQTLIGSYFQGFGGGLGSMGPIVMMVAIFAIFYFLLIMPQQRKQKKWAGDADADQAGRPGCDQRWLDWRDYVGERRHR